MAWRIELSALARRSLGELDRQDAHRILRFLHDRVAGLENPRSIGAPLKGSKRGELWRYRVGDYRVVASIEDEAVRVLIVRIDHRREIYRRQS